MITNLKQAKSVVLSDENLCIALDLIKFGLKSKSKHAHDIKMYGFSWIESFKSRNEWGNLSHGARSEFGRIQKIARNLVHGN